MKTLIALITCHGREIYADALRETWLSKITEGVDHRFFMGRTATREPKVDEVFLDCDDSYQGLPNKVQEIVRWALVQGYDFVLKCDDDVVLLPLRYANSGYQNYDFVGHTNGDNGSVLVPWGFCYTLSRKAMEIVAKAPLPNNNNDEAWVAYTLYDYGIRLHNDNRYHLYTGRYEDFAPKVPRPLRAPKREKPREAGPAELVGEGSFAFCMYIQWMGYRNFPTEMNIATLKKVFKETQ